MSAAAMMRWPPLQPSAVEIAIASCDPGRRIVLPQCVRDIAPQDMMREYEKMRRVVYGGGDVKECRGVVAQIGGRMSASSSSTSSSSSSSSSSSRRSQWRVQHNGWLSVIGGGGAVECHKKVVDMGRYIDVLSKKEACRDPSLIDQNAEEENSLQGLMNRKLSVDFGNRYKNGEKGMGGGTGGSLGGMEIETNTGVKILRDEVVNIDEKDKEKEKEKTDDTGIASLLDDSASYFMDTPMPPVEEEEEDIYNLDEADNFDCSPSTDRDTDRDSEYGYDDGDVGGDHDRKRENERQRVVRVKKNSIIDLTGDMPASQSNSTKISSAISNAANNSSGSRVLYDAPGESSTPPHLQSIFDNPPTPFITTSTSTSFPSSFSAPPPSFPLLALPPLGRTFASINGKRKRMLMTGTIGMGIAVVSAYPPSDSTLQSTSNSYTDISTSATGSGDGQKNVQKYGQLEIDVSNLSALKSTSALSSSFPSPSSPLSTPPSSPSFKSNAGTSFNATQTSTTPPPLDPTLNTPPHPISDQAPSLSESDSLPPGWVHKVSKREKKSYWFNVNNGQSVWVKPTA